ncbi:UDP-N-acetylglucosamine 2-epimerase [Euzebya pacifica]|uniref:UDP-N-acetylglucosamine 2-epimerase n=1 Tax=Euzebya pacifica TaxID=1608957 RepID=A0A346XW13_9ACTN|nr:UDP-N-acetylglucosamine 2-epimerase (non-hydrolyzing) [Euzebya pacifica]AXV06410.1 UDP-N-acetylglucosamine 2-epimerase [Euzebya pacifica]
MKLLSVVGARPQFIKAAVISRAIADLNAAAGDKGHVADVIVHTGQHYDTTMSQVFFDELSIPDPVHNLEVSGGTHGEMTGRMLERLEAVIIEESPDWVLVHGDTNSTLAGALAATKLHVPLAHVESGLRSYNRRMPEEINRIVTDSIADLLFVPTEQARSNLLSEGVPGERIIPVGDVMFDATKFYAPLAEQRSAVRATHGLESGNYVLATVHRAENTDDPARLKQIVMGLSRLSEENTVVLPLHPRTRLALEAAGLLDDVGSSLLLIEPVGYLEMLDLERNARVIATDSGGVQKEAYFAGVGCVTLRDETEWVELVEAGVNVLAGADADRIVAAAEQLRQVDPEPGLYGDGQAGEKVVSALVEVTRQRKRC